MPVALALWHLHTSICLPPKGQGVEMAAPERAVRVRGQHRDAGGLRGRGRPARMFGWMVHVYPYETRLEDAFRMPGHHDRGPAGAPAQEGRAPILVEPEPAPYRYRFARFISPIR